MTSFVSQAIAMGLDIRTMIIMTSLLALMLAGLLALASLHADNIRGIRHWALAEFCIGLGLGVSFSFPQVVPGSGWAILTGAVLMVVGLNLQWAGIRVFQGMAPRWRWMAAATVLLVLLDLWFAILHPDVAGRAIANSLLFAVINLACARALLIDVQPPLRTAYRLTGGSFALLALLFLARAVYVYSVPSGGYGLYAQLAINPVTFFIGSIIQLSLVFGFVLMINYKIAGDLQVLAARDGLTGALNRRSLEEEFGHLRALYSRAGGVMSVMIIDVDHFKEINDKHGHLVGDEVLRRLARLIESAIRKQDYFARYGGEEFCILMPATAEPEAAMIAERIRERSAATSMAVEGSDWFSTVSIGVADSAMAGFEFAPLIAAADQSMYAAKQAGRNRVVTYSSMI